MSGCCSCRGTQVGGSRVLIVDNEPEYRLAQQRLLEMWDYEPVVAEGFGERLMDSAVDLARRYRCRLAVVDAQLQNDELRTDDSGLALLGRLDPARTVMVGYNLPAGTVTEALRRGAFDCVDKELGPDPLRSALDRAACHACCCRTDTFIEMPAGYTTESIARSLCPETAEALSVEVDCVLGQLFPAAQHIALEVITGVEAASGISLSAMRQRSVVFRATVDHLPALTVVKIARSARVTEEVRRFKEHIEDRLPWRTYPSLTAHRVLWDFAGVAYDFIGGADKAGAARTFTRFFAEEDDPEVLVRPLASFFSTRCWGYLYDNDPGRKPGLGNLVSAYDRTWEGQLSEWFPAWQALPATTTVAGFGPAVIQPARWLVDNQARSAEVPWTEAVTHGDLHGDNLFIDEDMRPFPIDFERTGSGPILRDVVELIQDVITRLVDVGDEDLALCYELAAALCVPATPDEAMPVTRAILDQPGAAKAHRVAQALLDVAAHGVHSGDHRELLWGILLDSLFVYRVVPPEAPRWRRTLLLAAVICQRLDTWPNPDWLPADWPSPAWLTVDV
jgi:ActR/RegA family two-component response regulator